MKQTLEKLESLEGYNRSNTTKHVALDRYERMSVYDIGDFVDGFVVDTNHVNGLEVHIVDTLGYIHIFNMKSKLYITSLSGRPSQIKLYYRQLGIRYSRIIQDAIITAFKRNESKGYNKI